MPTTGGGGAFAKGSTDKQKAGQFADWVSRGRLNLIQDGVADVPRLSNGVSLVNCRKSESLGGALHIACRNNFPHVLEFLLQQADIDVNLRTSLDETPLHVAAQFNRVECIQLLLKARGIDREALNKSGRTSLHDAVFDNREPAVRALAKEVRDIAWKGSHVVHTAVSRGYAHLVQILHAAAFSMSQLNSDGLSCLHLAVQKKQMECVQLLTATLHVDPTVRTLPKSSRTASQSVQDLAKSTGNAALIHLINDYCTKWEAWSRDLGEEAQSPGMCKLYFLGDELVGKSALLESMQRSWLAQLVHQKHNMSDDERERTSGVNIVELDQKFSCWDFAGQTDDYVTHDFFLTSSNTIFLVLVNMCDPLDRQRAQLKQWLRFIKTCFRGALDLDGTRRNSDNAARLALDEIVRAPVVVVCTHQDLVEDPTDCTESGKLMVGEMRELFKDFLHIHDDVLFMDATGSSTGEMEVLRSTVSDCREQLVKDQPKVPKICHAIASELRRAKDAYSGAKSVLSFGKYLKFVREKVNPLVSPERLRSLTTCLSATANLFYHKDMPDVVVLDPHWLCSDVLGVMLSPQRFQKTRLRCDQNGIVEKWQLYQVFPDLNAKLLDTLLDFFQLHIPLAGDADRLQLPSLLQDSRTPDARVPDDIWLEMDPGEAVAIGRRFSCVSELDAFSPGFFPRLQVRTWKKCKNGSTLRLWKGGMYIRSPVGRNQELKQEVLLQTDGCQIDIAIRVPREFAKILPEQLDYVHFCVNLAITTFSSSIRLDLLALSCHDLCGKHAAGTHRHAYAIRDVCLAERQGLTMRHPTAAASGEDPGALLHAGVQAQCFAAKKASAHIMYLDDLCLQQLNEELNKLSPDSGNWRHLAQSLAMGDLIEIFSVRPLEATARLMERYLISPHASIKDFRKQLAMKVKNTEATNAVTRCLARMCES